MNNPMTLTSAPRTRLSSRARLICSVAGVAAAAFGAAPAHASAPDFGKLVAAVQSSQAISLASSFDQTSRIAPAAASAGSYQGFGELSASLLDSAPSPVLSVGLIDHDREVVVGQHATFIGYSNYPGAIERSELRILRAGATIDDTPHVVAPFDAHSTARWIPTGYADANMSYVLRAYDAAGNFDETAPLPLNVLRAGEMPSQGIVSRAEFGSNDAAHVRGIATHDLHAVLATGTLADPAATLMIEGQIVPVAADGQFAAAVLQPRGRTGVGVRLHYDWGAVAHDVAVLPGVTIAPLAPAPLQAVAAPPAYRAVPGSGLEIRHEDTAVATPVTDHAIEVRADGHVTEPVMAVGLIGSQRAVVRGEPAAFQAYTNYPSYVARGEVRVFAGGSTADAAPLAVVPTDANGFAEWRGGADAPADLFYVYRVYDDKGRFDETAPEELTLVAEAVTPDIAANARPNFGLVDEARVRNIQLNRSATVTVSGRADPAAELVRVSGQIVPVNPDGQFIAQQLVDRDSRTVRVTVDQGGQTMFAASRDIDVPRSDWFIVGQGDLTFRSMSGSGTAVAVSGDPLADGNSITSRAAFYAKGKFGDGWKLTTSLDTGETLLKDMFSNLDRKDPRQLLRRLSSNEYYATYGDDSTLVEDAPTQGQFYLKLQKADSSLMVGNYVVDMNQAELAPLDRGLFGVALDHKSTATTSFGERKAQLTLFASDPGTVPGRDEFRGTGGSLYFLQRQDLSVGSERVRVEVRDRDTGLVLETRDLRPQEDYDIDYFQGRVTLLKPLASTVATGSTVREASSTGNVPVLVVRYEYTPPVGSLDGYTLGGRGAMWFGDKLRVGATAQRETTAAADQTLVGADAMFRLTAGTYLKGEVAQTDGPGFGQANSVDGGLSFTDIAAPGVIGRKAMARRVEGAVNFGEIAGKPGDRGTASAFYEQFDAGYAASSQLTQSDTTRWGAAVDLPLGDATRVAAKYESLRSDSTGAHHVASVDLSQRFGGGMEAKLGVRHDRQAAGLLYNSTQTGARTDAALQLGYNPAGQYWSAYAFGQATLQADGGRSRNNRAGIGGKAEISDRTSLSAEVSTGDGGVGADVQLNQRYGKGSEAYIGYALLADRPDAGFAPVNLFTRSNRGTLTVGARHRFSSSLSIFGENRLGHGGTAPSTMRSVGLKFDPNEKVSFSASFENGRIDDATTGLFRRTAATFGFGYTTKDVQFGSNVEARFERGNGRNQNVWLIRNSASVKLNPDWRALGRFNVAVADNEGTSVRAADYVEAVLGFAYRPVLHDRLNVLARVNYFQDLGPVGQITAGGETASPKQRSVIGTIDVNYDLSKTLTIGGKYGYRQGSVSLDRTSNQFVSSNTHLGVVRLDWRPVKQWDAVLEGRVLSNDRAGDRRWGGLAAIYRHVGNNAKIGVGYSISDFSDDLTDQSYRSRGFFVNLLGKF